MALPKKKSRNITVNDTSYRWVANGNDHGVDVYVELSDDPGQILKSVAGYVYDSAKNRVAITPKHIEKLIISALDDGWMPEENIPTFMYNKKILLE